MVIAGVNVFKVIIYQKKKKIMTCIYHEDNKIKTIIFCLIGYFNDIIKIKI